LAFLRGLRASVFGCGLGQRRASVVELVCHGPNDDQGPATGRHSLRAEALGATRASNPLARSYQPGGGSIPPAPSTHFGLFK